MLVHLKISSPGSQARPLFGGRGACRWRRALSLSAHQRGPPAPSASLHDLIKPPAGDQAQRRQASRRQALLLGAAGPVACCATCSRSGFLDRLFAEAMATGMQEYEQEVAPVKRLLFQQLAEGLRPPPGQTSKVLEIGIGTGPNLAYYPATGEGPAVDITGVDPNPYMLPYLRKVAQEAGWPEGRLEWVEGRAEALPLPDASVDAVVCTLVLCSVADVPAVLRQVQRVLRPGGSFLFIEHTVAPQGRPFLRLGQRVLDPLQQLLADGCHLTRDPLPAIEAAGFASVDAKRFTVEGMGLIGPHVAGLARLG